MDTLESLETHIVIGLQAFGDLSNRTLLAQDKQIATYKYHDFDKAVPQGSPHRMR